MGAGSSTGVASGERERKLERKLERRNDRERACLAHGGCACRYLNQNSLSSVPAGLFDRTTALNKL